MYPIRPGRVTGCLLEYHRVETLQSAIQLAATLLCCAACASYLYVLLSRDPKASPGPGGKRGGGGGGAGGSIYSIEYSPQGGGLMNGNDSTESTALYSNVAAIDGNRAVQMTPRRVKRRSYTRSSARSARSHRDRSGASGKRGAGGGLASLPGGSLRLKSTNPVTRLMESDNRPPFRSMNDSSTSNDEAGRGREAVVGLFGGGVAASTAPTSSGVADRQPLQLPQQLPGYGQINPAYESSRPNSLYSNGKSKKQNIDATENYFLYFSRGRRRCLQPAALCSNVLLKLPRTEDSDASGCQRVHPRKPHSATAATTAATTSAGHASAAW